MKLDPSFWEMIWGDACLVHCRLAQIVAERTEFPISKGKVGEIRGLNISK
jgi:hypothetical protein